MPSKTMPTKAQALTFLQLLVSGLQQHFPNGSFTIRTTVYTTATLVQLVQGLADAITRANAAQAAATDAVAELRAARARVAPVITVLARILVGMFTGDTQMLADFGLQPPKTPTPLTSEQRAIKEAKMRATREARGTTSKKQKLAIKGNVIGVTVTPTTSTPAAAPAEPVPTK